MASTRKTSRKAKAMSKNFLRVPTPARARTMPLRPTLIRALVIGVAAAVIAAGLEVFLIPASTVLEVLLAAVMAFVVAFLLNVFIPTPGRGER
jgi:uncharacterized membrane protein YbhN (UPF0104 family)